MGTLHILHVSDLHYEESSKNLHLQISNALIKDILKVGHKHAARPDLVVFSGDFVHRGSDGTEAYQGVSTHYVKPLLSALGLTQEQFFCVPGNHDVDRNSCYKEFENGLGSELTNSPALNDYCRACSAEAPRFAPIFP